MTPGRSTCPTARRPPAVDVTELTARAPAAEQRLRDATLALDAAIDEPTPTVGALRDAIDGVSRAGVPGAVPPIGVLHGAPGDAAPPEAIDAAASRRRRRQRPSCPARRARRS